jgi:hypothetical protein
VKIRITAFNQSQPEVTVVLYCMLRKFRENNSNFREIFAKTAIFAENIPKFCEKTNIFAKTKFCEISQKLSHFRMIFAFLQMHFGFNPGVNHVFKQFSSSSILFRSDNFSPIRYSIGVSEVKICNTICDILILF